MTKTQIKKHVRLFRELDQLAADAITKNDLRNMGRYMDARAEIGRVLYESDYATWKEIHAARTRMA